MPALEKETLLSRLTALGEQSVAGTAIEIAEVELRGSGKARLLRVYIDKAGGVTHEDCKYVSEHFGALLDETDAIPGEAYTLEVSSPGVDRALKKPRDFERVVGQKVKLTLREPIANQRWLEGRLAAFADGTLEIEAAPGAIQRIPLDQVQKANLKFEW